ncbi:hypothetical protein BKA19_2528 [Blastococcus saxobsidens]|uniref:Uncharacterized protein n=1 Tax=Blastococcus saxobsidens TaxID=138336 RepID=A0A4Q7Y9R5_9ACTN|nr:hypothetical protein BKA19_2528 [Blastococcus saxobsidens]
MPVDCAKLFALGQRFGRDGSLVLEDVGAEITDRELHLGTFRPEQPVAFRIQEKRMLGDVVGPRGAGDAAPQGVLPGARLVGRQRPPRPEGHVPDLRDLPDPGSARRRPGAALLRTNAATGRLIPTFVRLRADRAHSDLPG